MLIGAAALGAPLSAAAHDFWVRPTKFTPAVNERINIRLLVGDRADLGEIERRPDHIVRFEAMRDGKRQPIAGVPGRIPAGRDTFAEPGVHVLVYQSRHTFIELPAVKFEGYLEDEGLGEIIAAREKSGARAAAGREDYARYCKSVIRVGGGSSAGFDNLVGLPAELILETDPFAWQSGDSLILRLLFEGNPLPGRKVKLIHLEDPERRLTAITDSEGHVHFQPPVPGPWLATTVHMLAATPPLEGDWESFWTSLTFELSGSPSR